MGRPLLNSILSISIFTVLLLTGCLEPTSSSTSTATQAKLLQNNSGGNGDYYGGKPDPGVYRRVGSDDECESCKTEVLQINSSSATLMQKNKTTRTNVRTAVNLDEIEYASYNPGRVGFQDGIYIKTSALASHCPAFLLAGLLTQLFSV